MTDENQQPVSLCETPDAPSIEEIFFSVGRSKHHFGAPFLMTPLYVFQPVHRHPCHATPLSDRVMVIIKATLPDQAPVHGAGTANYTVRLSPTSGHLHEAYLRGLTFPNCFFIWKLHPYSECTGPPIIVGALFHESHHSILQYH